MLGYAVPPEDTVIIVPDRRPDDKVINFRTGKRAAAEHDADYKRTVDRLLVAGKTVRMAKTPDCRHAGGGECSDADGVLRQHGAVRFRELIEEVEDRGLSLDGEARRLAQIDDPLERDAASGTRTSRSTAARRASVSLTASTAF